MAAEGENPFLIVPPPGLLPPPREPAEPAAHETIGGDSATRRISPPREPAVTRPPAAKGIPFVSSAAMPVAPVAPPAPTAFSTPAVLTPTPQAAPVAETPGASAIDNDETRVVAPRDSSTSTWRLVLPDGATTTIGAATFVGRNPTRAAGDVEGDLLPVDDTTKSVSKTHAVIEVLDGHLWVTDLNSTNGVFVTAEGQDDVLANPGERTYVPAGSDIELGEFVIQVERG